MAPRLREVPLLLAVIAGGCTLEHRPDVQPDDEAVAAETPSVPGASVEDSARAVASAFREALVLGDASRVASLTAPGALLVDQEEGVRWRRSAESDGPLPAPLGASRGGLGWTVSASEFANLDGTALLVTRYGAEVAGEEVPWSAVESLVLVRTGDGWRVRYLHRSRGQAEGGGGP